MHTSGYSNVNLIANKTSLSATGHIGTTAYPIDAQLNHLESKANYGNTYIENAGTLELGGVVAEQTGIASGGEVIIVVEGAVNITEAITATPENPLAKGGVIIQAQENSDAGRDITVASTASLESTYSKVQLLAGDNITLEAGSSVVAETTVELFADYQNDDASGILGNGLAAGQRGAFV